MATSLNQLSVTQPTAVSMYPSPQEKISVIIVGETGIEEKYEFDFNLRVLDLKKELRDKYNLENFKIEREGGAELESSSTLRGEGIKNGEKLILKRKIDPFFEIDKKNKGKASTSELCPTYLHFVDFNKEIRVPISDDQQPGLNLRGTCQNCGIVHIPQGFSDKGTGGVFEMKVACTDTKCSKCESDLRINNCTLWNCIYLIEGTKKDDSPFSERNGKEELGLNRALSFDIGENEENVIAWKSLTIMAKEDKKWFTTQRIATTATLIIAGLAIYYLWSKTQAKH